MAMLISTALAAAAFGDMQIMPTRSLGEISKLKGVNVAVQKHDGLVSVAIDIDDANEFVGATGSTSGRLVIRSADGSLIASVLLEPFGGTRYLRKDGNSYHTIRFSLRPEDLKESTLTFWEEGVRHTKKHPVILTGALDLTKS